MPGRIAACASHHGINEEAGLGMLALLLYKSLHEVEVIIIKNKEAGIVIIHA